MKYFKSSDKVASVIAAVVKLLKSDKLWPCVWKVPLSEVTLVQLSENGRQHYDVRFLAFQHSFLRKMCIVISGENNNHLKKDVAIYKKITAE